MQAKTAQDNAFKRRCRQRQHKTMRSRGDAGKDSTRQCIQEEMPAFREHETIQEVVHETAGYYLGCMPHGRGKTHVPPASGAQTKYHTFIQPRMDPEVYKHSMTLLQHVLYNSGATELYSTA
eukprot:362928-Chlamydomonas_euryale.AAC.7